MSLGNKSLFQSGAKRNVLEAVAWLAFAIVAFVLSLEFDNPLPNFKFGAAFWPQLVLIGVILAALILLASCFVHGKETHDHGDKRNSLGENQEETGALSFGLVVIFVLPLIWVYGMHKMGFLFVTPVFLVAFTWLMGLRRWRSLLVFSAGFYAIIVLVFYKLIFTPLPQGAGWFHSLNGELIALFQ